MKKALIIAFVTLIAASGYIYKDHLTAKIKVLPLTYELNKPLMDLETINNANILIIGDQNGTKLARFKDEIIEKTSKNLQTPLKIADISTTNEGIHRTINKLKNIKKLPEVVIYHANGSEFYERKVDVRDYEVVLNNIKTYQDEKKISLIMTFPFLSKFLYRPTTNFNLAKDFKKNTFKYPAIFKQKQMELIYKLYKIELNELFSITKKQKSTLIIVPTPINLILPPKKVCSNSTTTSIDNDLDNFDKEIKEGNLKTVIPQLTDYSKAALGNARAYYLLGKAQLEFGNTVSAINNFKQAAAYDCETWRPSPVINSIQRKFSKSNGVPLVDFANIVHLEIGRNDLFIDNFFPHDIYYQEAADNLSKKIIKILNL